MIRGLILVLALMATTPGRTAESQYLKGVTAMRYGGLTEPNEAPCKIDWRAWNTSIDSAANHTTKLKFMTESNHYDQVTALYARMKTPSLGNAEAMRKWNEEREKVDKFTRMPKLEYKISPIDAVGTCVAMIDAWAGAELKDTTIISTGSSVHLPTMRIWSKSRSIKSPYQGFSEFAIKVSEEMFQEFVNDWTASQNLP
jgi:hypothetical protein